MLIDQYVDTAVFIQLKFICSKSTIETLEKSVVYSHCRRCSVFILTLNFNFEHISHLFVVFQLLPLNKLMLAG